MEIVGVIALVLLAVFVLAALVVSARELPSLRRYLRIRRM